MTEPVSNNNDRNGNRQGDINQAVNDHLGVPVSGQVPSSVPIIDVEASMRYMSAREVNAETPRKIGRVIRKLYYDVSGMSPEDARKAALSVVFDAAISLVFVGDEIGRFRERCYSIADKYNKETEDGKRLQRSLEAEGLFNGVNNRRERIARVLLLIIIVGLSIIAKQVPIIASVIAVIILSLFMCCILCRALKSKESVLQKEALVIMNIKEIEVLSSDYEARFGRRLWHDIKTSFKHIWKAFMDLLGIQYSTIEEMSVSGSKVKILVSGRYSTIALIVQKLKDVSGFGENE